MEQRIVTACVVVISAAICYGMLTAPTAKPSRINTPKIEKDVSYKEKEAFVQQHTEECAKLGGKEFLAWLKDKAKMTDLERELFIWKLITVHARSHAPEGLGPLEALAWQLCLPD